MIIGILNSGGDCPGINAVIEGYVSAAYRRGWRVIGFHDGFEGLLPIAGGRRYETLTPSKAHKIRAYGGTILGTTTNGLKGSMWKSFFHHPRMLWCCAHYFGAIDAPCSDK